MESSDHQGSDKELLGLKANVTTLLTVQFLSNFYVNTFIELVNGRIDLHRFPTKS